MSEVKKRSISKAWAPPLFPVGGRFPTDASTVTANYQKQTAEENFFRQGVDARGQKRHSDCCHSLHISLFFDGTNNNNDNDTKKNHPSNIAKLFHASLRGREAEEDGYFSYYMPGVGTPFPEIGELDYSEGGLKYATGGEDRINWALVQVASALSFALTKSVIDDAVAKTKVEAMSTLKAPLMSALGRGNRRRTMNELLAPLQAKKELAKPRVLVVKLFVYGFSRGAAEARTFVSWLSQLFDTPEGAEQPVKELAGLPVSVEFLGLLDTVASVGIAHAAPFFAGHMDWADDTQLLPDAQRFPNLVKCCRHLVAGFEQRSCFPLDSIRNEDGQYPADTCEVVYPGVHSDVGGGYPENDQGKARGGTDELVSQIVLHDLYAAAFSAGAPLQVLEAVLPKNLLSQSQWRSMGRDTLREFNISPVLVERFNAWRSKTLLVIETEESINGLTWEYKPPRLSATVEDALADQLGWITGWRIGRYVNDLKDDNDSYKRQPYFTQAKEVTAYTASEERKDYEKEVADMPRKRLKNPDLPGPRIYEPTIDQTQLSQAAAEFKSDYLGKKREQTDWKGIALDVVLRDAIYLLNQNDERKDHATLRAVGKQRSEQLFRDTQGTPSADPGMALLVALFDDQIHDSRAWFMYDALKSREMWAGYFFYRMTYFGNENSRDLSPVVVAGRILGVAMLAGATVYGIKRAGGLGGVGGLAAGLGVAAIGYQVIDRATGLVVPFLPGAEELLKPTDNIGKVVAEQKHQIAQDDYRQRIAKTSDMLRKAGSLVEQVEQIKAVVA
ncbi:DUF2235 domain-containing protein [Pseudomonas sp. 25 R 14]|uniref:T6SS phospholipase effector Tle1-like catalytic domain-containing protein n=1 Tax=Pseudomonas sp. 25 R 14 TaxID=1844109 RepID=UPI00081283D9|nr:DUF2235 domain-containing protein [Pseudomonas sp. 25 R 14]CRM80125.1 hypothetical protein [Pseudomonas sp. 25 R 14]